MDDKSVYYCFTLSEEQLKFLRSKKYKIDRMECFMSLVELAARDTKLVPISKTQQVEILRGQVMIDNTQLAKLWDKDRKTVPKLLEAMEALGISSSQKVGENRIHTLHSLSGWYVDGQLITNSFALRRNSDNTAIIHKDVPPVRVVTIENPDGSNVDGNVSSLDRNFCPHINEGKISASDAGVSQPSPQSNDSGSVGNSQSDVKSSDTSLNNFSLPSDDISSSAEEAYGIQNGGKGKEQSSAQQNEVSAQPDGSLSDGNGSSFQTVAGGNAPDGSSSDV